MLDYNDKENYGLLIALSFKAFWDVISISYLVYLWGNRRRNSKEIIIIKCKALAWVQCGNQKNRGICFNVDGTGGYYAEWNKSIGEGQTLYVLIHLGNIYNSERE